MANILYLVHRLPYPPNKGDKVRSFHLLKHLLAQHRVFLGTFIDDPEDAVHVDTLRSMCADLCAVRLSPRLARLRSLQGLAARQPLTLGYYRDARLASWVDETIAKERIDAAVVFSSSMAQYVEHLDNLPTLVDFVDLDSAKWSQYASSRSWPMSWLYRREGEHLLAYERAVATKVQHSFFVTEGEAQLFLRSAPESAARVQAMGNGVDCDYFQPAPERASPFSGRHLPIVFTGAMDYWPNVDAAVWFADEVMPAIRSRWPAAHFHIVGRNPTPAVEALESDAVTVSGTVPDVRPYLQHAAVVVAPLRVARGIQNKILEAMAMGCAVVASRASAAAIETEGRTALLDATDAQEFADQVGSLLSSSRRARGIGEAARACVAQRYSWRAHLSSIDRHIDEALSSARVVGSVPMEVPA
jgi:polysaccharide biosynthesis protein PslH